MAEKEYIEREAALKVLCDACGNAACPKSLIPRCSYYEKMQSIPAADVRPVVTCADCKFWDRERISCEGLARCNTGESGVRYRNRNDFCSRGKREES